jgi:CRISPR-associated protein Cas5d
MSYKSPTPPTYKPPGASCSFTLEVWGDFACFSRPELKIERFSYPVITPSAARGIFDSIYAKPIEFRWQIERIEIYKPPAYIALRRNEVKDVVNVNAVYRWMRGEEPPRPIYADADREFSGSDEKGRTQRQTMALKNVCYRLTASIWPWPGFTTKTHQLEDQFLRRASRGKCFCQPCFGCREFPAFFRTVDADDPVASPEPWSADLGLMLYDVFDLSRPGTSQSKAAVSLFHATVLNGVLEVPPYSSDSVLKATTHNSVNGGPA